jgi:proteic killer suppression protein
LALDAMRDAPYTYGVIKSFNDRETEKVYQRLFSKKFPRDIQPTALRKLRMLNNAHSTQDLRSPPGNRLEKLKGDREGQYSIRINDQWRICFLWRNTDVFEAEITDYH